MKKSSVLGDETPASFLKKYWQKKPLLIRQAIPQMAPLLSREQLFALAMHDDVESRLITRSRNQWKLEHGPFSKLPATTRKDWTLLVHGVNLHDDQAERLLHQFRFIPDSRLDDLMISYATDRGGVGAHFDSYDVFLLQARGQRRWRISAQQDLTLQTGLPLKILRHFAPEQEFVLNPGDMLYLPPHYAHEGVAIGECMTYSIGFRAPAWQELGEAFLHFLADTFEMTDRYRDPGLQPSSHPAEISVNMVDTVAKRLEKLRGSRSDIEIFLGEYLSEPKASVCFEPPSQPPSPKRFSSIIRQQGIRLHRKSRMLYRGGLVFLNGESYRPARADQRLLQQLADHRTLNDIALQRISVDLLESLYQWYRDGWITIAPAEFSN